MTKNTGQPVRLEMPFRYWIGGINLVAEGEKSREAKIRIFKTTPGYRVTVKVGRIGEGWISKEITVPCPSAGSGTKVPDGSGVFFRFVFIFPAEHRDLQSQNTFSLRGGTSVFEKQNPVH